MWPTKLSFLPWLGPKTKRICGYVPGLATQRRALEEEARRQSNRANIFLHKPIAEEMIGACKASFSVTSRSDQLVNR